MRRLVLMRHAKTQASHPRGDHSRELLPAGVQDAQEAGLQLRPLGLEHALVSTATRARQTFAALGLDIPVEYLDDLYYEGVDALIRHISETDPAVNGLLVVGHAPTIPALASHLGNASNSQEADRHLRRRLVQPGSLRAGSREDGTHRPPLNLHGGVVSTRPTH